MNQMKERLEAINRMSRELYNLTEGKETISRSTAQTLQAVLDDMQDELDQIMNELTRPEGYDLKSDPLTKRQK